MLILGLERPRGLGMSASKPKDIVFSFEKPYLLAYSFFSFPWDLLSGKSKLTAGKDRPLISYHEIQVCHDICKGLNLICCHRESYKWN
jgi:hypothetical protein